MSLYTQIVVTIDSDNDVSATVRIHDGDTPTFDERKPISDNTVRSHFRNTHYPHFSKAPHRLEVVAIATAAEYLAEVVASQPTRARRNLEYGNQKGTEDDAPGQSPPPPASLGH